MRNLRWKRRDSLANSKKNTFVLDHLSFGYLNGCTTHHNAWCLQFNALHLWKINVCVRVGGLRGFLLPLPPFSISSAFSQEISKWLFIDSTLLYVSRHPSPTSDNRRGLKWGLGLTWSQRTQFLCNHSCLWQLLSPEAAASCLWTQHTQIHTYANREKPGKTPISLWINGIRNVWIFSDWGDWKTMSFVECVYISEQWAE